MKPDTINYILYARVAGETVVEREYSVDAQIEAMQKLATERNLNIVAIRNEVASAGQPGRHEFNAMLDDIETGKTQGIIAKDINRLSRNAVDTGRLIHLMDTGKLVEVVTPSQTFRHDNPNDKFLLNLLCGQMLFENRNSGRDVQRGLMHKAQMGIFPGRAPLGYVNDKYAEKGLKEIKPDRRRFPIVRKMFDLALSGKYSLSQIADIANRRWRFRTPQGNALTASTLSRVFASPFYFGRFEFPRGSGTWYTGKHQPMITSEEHDEVQTLLRQHRKTK